MARRRNEYFSLLDGLQTPISAEELASGVRQFGVFCEDAFGTFRFYEPSSKECIEAIDVLETYQRQLDAEDDDDEGVNPYFLNLGGEGSLLVAFGWPHEQRPHFAGAPNLLGRTRQTRKQVGEARSERSDLALIGALAMLVRGELGQIGQPKVDKQPQADEANGLITDGAITATIIAALPGVPSLSASRIEKRFTAAYKILREAGVRPRNRKSTR
jgi:hypothetical protein